MRLILTQFTIDVSLCCFCGLCTTVCPTDCLFHTHDYELSTYNAKDLKIDYLSAEVISQRTRLIEERKIQVARDSGPENLMF